MKKTARNRGKSSGTVRLIAGDWRGSRLPVPDLPGLRPSGDRSREILFNWLQPHIWKSKCVDLFAGSGALGLEAASRGAGHVTLVEMNGQAADVLKEAVNRLGAEQVEVFHGDALKWLNGVPAQSVDIAFVDPPFDSGLESTVLESLDARNVIVAGGFVYVETARSNAIALPGLGWTVAKEKRVGEVSMVLLEKLE